MRRHKGTAVHFPLAFSPIRTVTVGSGFAPDLLTLHKQALAGLQCQGNAYRR